MEEKYFAASNSADGFCSYYDGVFNIDELNKIYVIKGGSGTGKARFMRNIAERAEKHGMSVRYIYCSSDSTSLDGIIIKELGIAVLDGTAPHIYEPKMIGAVETVINLGEFLNEDMLRGSRKIIEDINRKKQTGFENAYRYLSAYRSISNNIESMIRTALKAEKINMFAERFVKNAVVENGNEEHLLVRSIGMRGLGNFDTYYTNAVIYYDVNDYFESAHILLDAIYRAMRKKHINMHLSNHPIIKERLDALRAVSTGLTFEIGNGMREGARVINMKRFLYADKISSLRGEYRSMIRVRDEILSLALNEFESVKKYHFILEEIYGSAMNFEAKEKFTESFCDKMFAGN